MRVGFLAIFLAVVTIVPNFIGNERIVAEETSVRHLVLGLDGVPFDTFVKAQKLGLFPSFQKPSKLISTFPSLSNYAWSKILNTQPIAGYQARHFDFQINQIVGSMFTEATRPSYPNRYDYISTGVIHKLIDYLANTGSLQKEMDELDRRVLSQLSPRLFFAYTEATDVIAHMGGEPAVLQMLAYVSLRLEKLKVQHLQKFGESLEITLLSDHGNRLVMGRTIVDPSEIIRGSRFELSKELNSENSVIFENTGILSCSLFYTWEENKLDLARFLSKQPFADRVVTWEKVRDIYHVFSNQGHLGFQKRREPNGDLSFKIVELEGLDPLDLVSYGMPFETWVSQAEVFEMSVQTNYPDSLRRIQDGLSEGVTHPASVIVSLGPDYESGSALLRKMAKIKGRAGTHGALAAADSVGMMVSTHKMYPLWVGDFDAHKFISGHDFGMRFAPVTIFTGYNGESLKVRLARELLRESGIKGFKLHLSLIPTESPRTAQNFKPIESREIRLENNRQPYLDVVFSKPLTSMQSYRLVIQKMGDLQGVKMRMGYLFHPFTYPTYYSFE